MHVRVLAANQEIPAGTERLLTILEGSIEEKKGDITEIRGLKIKEILGTENKNIVLDGPDKEFIKSGADLEFEGKSDKGKVHTAENGNIVLTSPITGLAAGISVVVKNEKTPLDTGGKSVTGINVNITVDQNNRSKVTIGSDYGGSLSEIKHMTVSGTKYEIQSIEGLEVTLKSEIPAKNKSANKAIIE
jgi:hypothetical protein